MALAMVLAVTSCGDPAPGVTGVPADVAPVAISRPPNVLIVVMDTTRADHCSVYGYGRSTTPELEELAAEGVAFDAAWAPCSWTLPSHASLFTGLAPERHLADLDLRAVLSPSAVTLAEILRGAGYATAGFSNNPFVADDFGLAQGFSTFMPLHAERNPAYPTAARAHRLALEWMQRQQAADRPFFAFVNDMEAHAPYTPPEELQIRFLQNSAVAGEVAWARSFELPANLRQVLRLTPLSAPRLSLIADLYDAEIATLDREIGSLVDGLRRGDLLDDTLVVVTSDHGEHLGENGRMSHGLTLERAVLHVPLVIRHPEHFAGGRRVPDVVSLTDVFSTVLEVCNLPVPEGLDSRSLCGDVTGRVATARLGRPIGPMGVCARELPEFDTASIDHSQRSVFDGRHLLVHADDAAGTRRLYDTIDDPRCESDLAAAHPDVVDRLAELLPARVGKPVRMAARSGD